VLALEQPSALRQLIQERLRDTAPHADFASARVASSVNALVRAHLPADPIAAAVLVPIVDHPDGLTVLLTRRAADLRHHAGQVSFPGGRIEPGDADAYRAALREAHEEIGLTPERVALAGYLPPQLVISGYWVTPVVALVQPGFALRLDTREVESTFEVPLTYILDRRNHHARDRALGTSSIRVYEIPFGPYNIWGATAAMLIELCRVLQGAPT
jgi:8-oxo-dGTP pyrophosphatase MutT (NUDIX family)